VAIGVSLGVLAGEPGGPRCHPGQGAVKDLGQASEATPFFERLCPEQLNVAAL
jgi:hypothetical protein